MPCAALHPGSIEEEGHRPVNGVDAVSQVLSARVNSLPEPQMTIPMLATLHPTRGHKHASAGVSSSLALLQCQNLIRELPSHPPLEPARTSLARFLVRVDSTARGGGREIVRSAISRSRTSSCRIHVFLDLKKILRNLGQPWHPQKHLPTVCGRGGPASGESGLRILEEDAAFVACIPRYGVSKCPFYLVKILIEP